MIPTSSLNAALWNYSLIISLFPLGSLFPSFFPSFPFFPPFPLSLFSTPSFPLSSGFFISFLFPSFLPFPSLSSPLPLSSGFFISFLLFPPFLLPFHPLASQYLIISFFPGSIVSHPLPLSSRVSFLSLYGVLIKYSLLQYIHELGNHCGSCSQVSIKEGSSIDKKTVFLVPRSWYVFPILPFKNIKKLERRYLGLLLICGYGEITNRCQFTRIL